MKSVIFLIHFTFPLAPALAQTDSLNACEKQFLEWKDALPPDLTGVYPQPVPIVNPAPSYPDSALHAGIEGTVWVWCIVDTAGIPKCARVYKGAGYGLDEAALEAVSKWRFKPAGYGNGKKWEQPVTIPFKFKLSGKE